LKLNPVLLVVALVLCWFPPTVASQSCAQNKPAKKKRAPQYKRVHQAALELIEKGEHDKAVAQLSSFSEKNPDDAETYYMLAVASSFANKPADARGYWALAVGKGLPPGRLIAGPRDLVKAVHADDNFKSRYLKDNQYRIVHGPMVGDVTSTSAKIWLRVAQERNVWVQLLDGKSGEVISTTKPIVASKANDYTAVIQLAKLEAERKYKYKVFVEGYQPGKSVDAFAGPFNLVTAPKMLKPSKFTLAFGGGSGYVPKHEYVWTTIKKQKPDMLLLLGDNVYIDHPLSEYMQHYCYYRRHSRPEWRGLIANVPVYTIWDDHDFATNDSWGESGIEEPKWKRPVWNIYKQNWANPAYGGGEKQPGCWYDFYRGDVHFIMLDGRYYRTSPKLPESERSMLGPVQLQWLKKTIANSKGTFKVICSPVPWTFKAKGGSPDTWNGYQKERNQIFDFLTEKKIEGVVLMSADRHRSDLWKTNRDSGYALYEFNSSRLTNQHIHPEMKQAEFSYNKKQSFGLVDVDTTKPDPTITYRIMSIDGDAIYKFELKRSKLQ
jgi:alkaline phosphatase D